MTKRRVHLPVVGASRPGGAWRWLRRATQALAFLAVLIAPFLGGWQRLDRNYLSAWDGHGWDLPEGLLAKLPLGDAPRKAYETNKLLGGGLAGDYLEIPAMDPVAGTLALLYSDWSWLMGLAWAIPLLLGVLMGRVFCGWFCPFGTISRVLDSALERLPWRPPPLKVPNSRWLRWLVLALSIGLGIAVSQSLLYLALPHLLVQQSAYSFWLMGGGGAAFGWLLGLIAAGLIFGPTAYCATLCPTGAALSLPSRLRLRLLHVTVAKVSDCGAHCQLCTSACWLSLDPASGDPGPECDGCARCFDVCPRTNLRIGLLRKPWHKAAATAAALAVALLSTGDAQAENPPEAKRGGTRPGLVLDSVKQLGNVRLLASVVSLEGVRRDADDPHTLSGIKLSIVAMRGRRGSANEVGKLQRRETYAGPLSVELFYRGYAEPAAVATIPAPNSPRSTVHPAVFEHHFPKVILDPGDRVTLRPVTGWFDEPVTWVVPPRNPGSNWKGVGWGAVGGFLVFSGLLSLALVGRKPERQSE